jgi:peroxiredoxin
MCVESDRAHRAFADFLSLPFPLLSDFNRVVVQQFGIAYTQEEPHSSGFWGHSRRSVFVVDQAGTVRYAWLADDAANAPDIEEVVRAVEALGSATAP